MLSSVSYPTAIPKFANPARKVASFGDRVPGAFLAVPPLVFACMSLYTNILKRATALDMHARIAGIARRDADDSTLVRIRTSNDTSLGVLAALRETFPLATVSLVQNLVDGKTEAQMLLPNAEGQLANAKILANYGRGQKPLRLLANLLLAALGIACAFRIAL